MSQENPFSFAEIKAAPVAESELTAMFEAVAVPGPAKGTDEWKKQRDDNYFKAVSLTGSFALSFTGLVSGSVIVDRYEANDIDVFVPAHAFYEDRLEGHYGMHQYDPMSGSEEYKQASEFQEIVALYRGNYDINLIVVDNDMWPAYKAAARKLADNPEAYKIKRDRQNLFIRHKNIIHEMLGRDTRQEL